MKPDYSQMSTRELLKSWTNLTFDRLSETAKQIADEKEQDSTNSHNLCLAISSAFLPLILDAHNIGYYTAVRDREYIETLNN